MLSSIALPPVIFPLAAPSALYSSCPYLDAKGQFLYSLQTLLLVFLHYKVNSILSL